MISLLHFITGGLINTLGLIFQTPHIQACTPRGSEMVVGNIPLQGIPLNYQACSNLLVLMTVPAQGAVWGSHTCTL